MLSPFSLVRILRGGPRAALVLIVFIDLLGFGMVIPVMALYAERLGAPTSQTGWLMASYSIMQFAFAPIWGRLSDRYGRRPLLLLSIAMTSLAFLAYALAPTFAWLVASRFFAGAATANIGLAQAYMADVTKPEERARGMGLIGAAFGMGFVLGPAFGGLLSSVSLATPGFVAAALAAANGVAAWFVLAEPENRVVAERKRRLGVLVDELSKPGIRRLIVIYLLVVFAFSGMESTFALLSEHRYGLNARTVGGIFAFIGVIIAVVQGLLIGPLNRRFGERALLVSGLVLQAVGLVALPFAPGLPGLFLACVPLAAGSGLSTPALSSLLSRSARADSQGGTLGVGQSASALGRVAGPPTATFVFGEIWIAGPYLGGAVVMLAMAALAATLRSPSPVPRQPAGAGIR